MLDDDPLLLAGHGSATSLGHEVEHPLAILTGAAMASSPMPTKVGLADEANARAQLTNERACQHRLVGESP